LDINCQSVNLVFAISEAFNFDFYEKGIKVILKTNIKQENKQVEFSAGKKSNR